MLFLLKGRGLMSLSPRLTEVRHPGWVGKGYFDRTKMCEHQRLYFSFFYFVLNKHNRKIWKLLPGQRPHIQTGSSREASNSLSAAMSLPGCKTGTPAHAALPEAKQATVLMGKEAPHEARCSLSSSQVAPLAGGEATTLPGELFACSLPAADAAAAHP